MATDEFRVLVEALQREDEAITNAGDALENARRAFEIASVKYAAVRDLIRERFHDDPYDIGGIPFTSGGRYRFLRMATGDAIVTVLKAADKPLTLEEIMPALRAGSLRKTPRAVNAALMRTRGVLVSKDGGTYIFDPENDPDDEEPEIEG